MGEKEREAPEFYLLSPSAYPARFCVGESDFGFIGKKKKKKKKTAANSGGIRRKKEVEKKNEDMALESLVPRRELWALV